MTSEPNNTDSDREPDRAFMAMLTARRPEASGYQPLTRINEHPRCAGADSVDMEEKTMKATVTNCQSNTEPERIKDKAYRIELTNRIRNNQSPEMRKYLESNLNGKK